MSGGDLNESPVRELLRRFLITFILGVVVYRLGVFVPIPGVDVAVLKAKVEGEFNNMIESATAQPATGK